MISSFTTNVFASVKFRSILTVLMLSNENELESRDPVPWTYTYQLPCISQGRWMPGYVCFYFWHSQTLDKAMSPWMVNWHLPATGPHTEKPGTRHALLVNGKIKGKSWRYSQLFGNNTKCSCFRDVCLLESQIKAGTNSKCPFYRGVRCTRSKRYPVSSVHAKGTPMATIKCGTKHMEQGGMTIPSRTHVWLKCLTRKPRFHYFFFLAKWWPDAFQ